MVGYRIEIINILYPNNGIWLLIKIHFSVAFVREIGRNDVLYSGIWPRHRVSNQNKGISMTCL